MTGPAPTHRWFLHEAATYGSDEEFLNIVVPFLRAGVTAGDPTVLQVNSRQEHLVRDALNSAADAVTMIGGDSAPGNPLTMLHDSRRLFTRHLDEGASRVRIVGEVPHVGGDQLVGAGWARYEASVNHFYAPLPVWALCPYDTRNASSAMIDDVRRTHVGHTTGDGKHRTNPRHTDPIDFLGELARAAAEPYEQRRPDIELTDPDLADARLAVATLAMGTPLDGRSISGLVFAANEVLTNAVVHGKRPIVLRAWADDDRVVVAVRDGGSGPRHPYAGLLRDPDEPSLSGDGLWMAYQMCSDLDMLVGPGGFTVYLTTRVSAAGGPWAGACGPLSPHPVTGPGED